MAELLFFRTESRVRAVVDGLDIAQYSDWGGGRFHVTVDGHLAPQCFRRSQVAGSEAQAQHWIRQWWLRDEAIIRAGFAKREAERRALQELERTQEDPVATRSAPARRPRRRPPRLK
jgi:hypothetical protein